ncbi:MULTISPECIES: DUF3857 domain-containing protein [unclassified Sphingobacterium]|uniref:DUF3857 domain-containing protein n=1 Tax=unclassified Sphingobacterium TaxID=2609468 RepID=UPI0025FFA825|nr:MULTISPECIES: DUF3857 domain-containing protein [unclassified Sphingobacterium]
MLPIPVRHIFLSFVFICLLQICASAQVPSIYQENKPVWIQKNTKSPQKINQRDIESGFVYESLDYQVHMEQKIVYSRQVKEIVSTDGVDQAGQIYVSFSPDYQKLFFHEIQIIRQGRVLNKLDIRKFKVVANETDLSRFLYNGTYAAYLILDDLRVGDKLVISYSLKGFNPAIGNKFADDYYFQGTEPIALNHVNYIAAKDRPVKFKTFNGQSDPRIEHLDQGLVSYSWEETNLPVIHSENYEPYWYFDHKYIQISDYQTWQEVADWAGKLNPVVTTNMGGTLKNKIEEFWSQSKGDSYKYLALVTRFVQNDIRYMGVEVGEYSHRSNNPNKVIEQRYGDCKDKSMLLATFLKAKGIDCDLVLVNSYNRYKLNDFLPTPWVFNHMVAVATVNERAQFIDPTFSNQGGNIRDLYFPFYGNALVIKPKTEIRNTPRDVTGKTKVLEQYKLLDSNRAQLIVSTIYTGYQADNNRGMLNSTSRTALEKNYLDYYTKLYPEIKRTDTVKIKDDREKNQIQIIETYEINKLAKTEDATNKKYLTFFASDMFSQIPAVNSNRKAPISLDFPYTAEYEIQFISDKAKDIQDAPVFIDRNSYTFGKSIKVVGDTLKMNFQLAIHEPSVAIDKVPEFMEDFNNTEDLFSYSYYVNDNGSIGYTNGGVSTISWFAIFIACIIVAFCGYIFYKWNKKEDNNRLIYQDYLPSIGGWLVLLGLGLGASLLRITVDFFTIGFFYSQLWSAYDIYGVSQGIVFRLLVGFELIVNLFIISLLIFSLYLYFKKRDIFPKVAILTISVMFFGPVLDLLFIELSGLKMPEESPESYVELIRTMIFGAIWCSYLVKSDRVKETFIVKYKNDDVNPMKVAEEEVPQHYNPDADNNEHDKEL